MRNWQNLTHLFEKDEVCAEMHKKYAHSILGIRVASGKVVYATYLKYSNGFHLFKDLDGVQLRLDHETDCEVFIAFPEKGLYNTPTGMVYFRRLPHRQYRKGITEENSQSNNVVHGIVLGHQYNTVVNDIRHIFAAEFPPTMEQALESLKDCPSVALNRSFGLSLSYDKNNPFPFVYYLDNVIGFVRGNEIVIKNKVFYQEAIEAACFNNYKLVLE